jgi:hypothetical protein
MMTIAEQSGNKPDSFGDMGIIIAFELIGALIAAFLTTLVIKVIDKANDKSSDKIDDESKDKQSGMKTVFILPDQSFKKSLGMELLANIF